VIAAPRRAPRRRTRSGDARTASSVAVVLAFAIAACSVPGPSIISTNGPGPSGAAAASTTLEPLTTFGPPPSPTPPDDASPLILDPSLLDVLPESVAGIPVEESADAAAEALTDPNLPAIATALDSAVAADAGNGNLAYATVVRLRRDALDEGKYRDWRDSYDEGACSASGGVVGHAEAEMDQRTVYITSCAAGLHTYHAWLGEQDILISVSSVGEGRFGELLMDNLRVPS
jgi:hypothetical protein